ncbi:hypothetical protein BWD42_24200 [Sphingobacterium sp. CZ-UAM]|uniref:hypothetical protein n=1 Tax=Sphingobacterium sp. CZ-UAM TaxID=1933868 RepID=UPI00098749F5|nr:hypothetical protein [Sphingobacterium sp. CZ-UAM]OOG15782.1 hypothetical protein BWD42_24200 [Sphingobacterium sp. CZ-UAM]
MFFFIKVEKHLINTVNSISKNKGRGIEDKIQGISIGGVKSSGSKNAYIFGGQLGYAFIVKDNIAIEPAVRYDRGLNDNPDGVVILS